MSGKLSLTERDTNSILILTDLSTGGHTFIVVDLADLASTAVSVGLTLHLGAAQLGVADMFGQTPTLSRSADHDTLRVSPARIQATVTGVDTGLIMVARGLRV